MQTDVLLTVAAPEVRIPRLLSLLNDFRTYSGYKLSYNYTRQKDRLNKC